MASTPPRPNQFVPQTPSTSPTPSSLSDSSTLINSVTSVGSDTPPRVDFSAIETEIANLALILSSIQTGIAAGAPVNEEALDYENDNRDVNIPATAKSTALLWLVSGGNAEIPIPWCDEVEKMISGMHFRGSTCAPLMQYRLKLTKLLKEFNEDPIPEGEVTMADVKEARMAIAKKFIARVGEDCNIPTPFFVGCGFTLFLGDKVYMNRDVSIYNNAPVIIGDRTLIGPSVTICTDTHEVDADARKEKGGSFAKRIHIGNDCWIGARATILAGVTIGNGSVIAAGAVVAKNVTAGTLVGGVPAKFIRYI